MSNENEVARLVSTRPDAEVAAELRARITEAFGPVLKILDDAVAAGLEVNFQIGREAPYYGYRITQLRISRHF